jgi:hypothetical protein
MGPKREDIVSKCAQYVGLCLGCRDDEPLFIATTEEESDIADLFWDARKVPGTEEESLDEPVPHSILRKESSIVAVRYTITRHGEVLRVEGDQNLSAWERLIDQYQAKHAVGFIDFRPGELPWRIAFIGVNEKKQLAYGHGPGTSMDHMKGHFMIDYKEAAEFGSRLTEKLSAPDILAYAVHSRRGTKYVVLKDGTTLWNNDLMPRPYRDPMTGELKGGVGNVPAGEVYEEYTEPRFVPELNTEIGVMVKRLAYGKWVADLSVGSVKKGLKQSNATATVYVGMDPDSGELVFDKPGVVTKWDCTDTEIKAAMQKDIDDDPYSKKRDLIIQESLAFGFNEKADPETDDLLEGEKAKALHIGFGGVLSHIDLLASLEPGTFVTLIKQNSSEGLALIPDDITAILDGNAAALGSRFRLDYIIKDGKYVF